MSCQIIKIFTRETRVSQDRSTKFPTTLPPPDSSRPGSFTLSPWNVRKICFPTKIDKIHDSDVYDKINYFLGYRFLVTESGYEGKTSTSLTRIYMETRDRVCN